MIESAAVTELKRCLASADDAGLEKELALFCHEGLNVHQRPDGLWNAWVCSAEVFAATRSEALRELARALSSVPWIEGC